MSTTPSVFAPPPRLAAGDAAAPVWHTAIVLLLLLGLAALAMVGGPSQAHHRIAGYLIIAASEWLIVGVIALGARRHGSTLSALAGDFSARWRTVGRDLLIALVFLVAAQVVLGAASWGVGRILPTTDTTDLRNLMPHTLAEDAVYLLLALTAGFCEEMIFRGYLQRQFTVWTGNAAAGIVAQAALFGASHLYQGAGSTIVIGIYGCMFGCLAWWRKSLRPGMFAHFLQDGVGGLLMARFLK